VFKGILKYILSLAILFLSVYGQVAALSGNGEQLPSVLQRITGTLQSYSQSRVFDHLVVAPSFPGTEKTSFQIAAPEVDENELEEDETGSSKRYLENVSYFLAASCQLLFGDWLLSRTVCLPVSKHASYFHPVRRHLLFQVFIV